MIFHQWQQVLDGSKTQMRKLVREGDEAFHFPPGYEELPIEYVRRRGTASRQGTVRFRVNQVYAVQPGLGKKAVGHVRIVRIRREELQRITVEDVEAEGINVAGRMPLVLPSSIRLAEFPEAELDRLALRLAHRDFAKHWDSIHTKPGERWEDNVEVWALDFERAEAGLY